MNYSDNLVAKLNAIAHDHKEIVYRSIVDVLNQYKNTGAGVGSVTVEVVEGNNNTAPQLMIAFDDRLIYLNKTKMQWTKLPDMKELVAWAKTVEPDEKKAERLAWSTGWDKKKNDTWKGKQWRKKSLSRVLKEMNQIIVQAFDQAIEEDLQHAVKV